MTLFVTLHSKTYLLSAFLSYSRRHRPTQGIQSSKRQSEGDIPVTGKDIAFQGRSEAELGHVSEQILPESHIRASLDKTGSIAYGAIEGGILVGGAIVQINPETHHHHPDALVWETGPRISRGAISIST